MKRLVTLLLAFFMAANLSLWITLPVFAQEDSEDDAFTLEEIIVTAEKTGAQDVQKISTSMSVISADELRKNAVTNFADALKETSGIAFQSMFGQIYVRGIGNTTDEADVSPGVQINVDNAPALTNAGTGVAQSPMFALTNDVERIEVIRGPSGSVNGRSASAGTVNIITTSPDFEKVDGKVGITYGNYETVQLNAALNFPMQLTGLDLPSYIENLSFRMAVAENKHSAYITNSDGEDVKGNQNSYNFRSKMKWQPIEDLELNASFSYSRMAQDESTEVPLLGGYSQYYADLSGRSTSEPHEDEPWVDATGSEMSAEQDASRQYSTNYEATYETPFANIYGRYSYSWVPKECREDEANCYEGKQGEGDYEFRLNNPLDSWITWNIGGAFTDRKTFTGPEEQLGVIDEDYDISFADWYSNGQYDRFGDYSDEFQNIDTDGYDLNDPTQPWNELTGRTTLVSGDTYWLKLEDAQRASKAYSAFANASIPLFEDRHRLVIGLRKNFERKKRAYSIGVFKPAESQAEVDELNAERAEKAAADPEYEYDTAYYNDGLPHWTFKANENSTTGEGTWYCDNCYLVDVEGPTDMVTDDDPVNFTLGWEYDWKEEVMLYAMIRNGYKPGGISAMAKPIQFYEPETLLAYSLGTKSRWFDQRLQLNLDIYLEEYKNYQQSLNNTNMYLYADVNGTTYSMIGDQSVMVNFPTTYIYGFDFDYEWLITRNDRLSGNVAYLHADYADFVYDCGQSTDAWRPTTMDYSGRTMPYSPRWATNMTYQHTFNFNNFYVTPRVSAQYKSKYYLHHETFWEIINPEMWQPAYTLFDAYASIGPQDGKWNVNLYWKNITEEPVRVMAAFNTIRLNDPMTYGMTFALNF